MPGKMNKGKITVRRAVSGDAARLALMLRKIAEYHRRARPDIFLPGSAKYGESDVLAKLADPDNIIFAAADADGNAVGYAMAVIRVPDAPHLVKRKVFYLDDLFVEEEYRGSGAGTLLMDACLNCARELSCGAFELNVWRFDGDASRFYEKYGFRVQRQEMELKLEEKEGKQNES